MADLKRTGLYDLHVELGAKMVPFAGYEMPVQYPLGVMKEHLHCRAQAGLFDVSHMGQVILRAKSGDLNDAVLALEALVPVALVELKENHQRYAFFTNDQGGILDDLMVAKREDHLCLVVNAACKDEDIAHLRANLSDTCDIDVIEDRALLALQGPAAEKVMARFVPLTQGMRFMEVSTFESPFGELWISRSGYTGEDGFEISVPNKTVVDFAHSLMSEEEVEFIGLGARDSLRLEAGLCLYGHDIDTTTSPIEADLLWAIQKARRPGGARQGGFPGEDRIFGDLAEGIARKRIGLRPEGRAPMREGTVLYASVDADTPIGTVTSGGFGPTVEGPVAMGYVSIAHANTGNTIYGEVRGKRLPATVTAMPFRPSTYKR
ncbi:glycine cleavage system aminomethyltransferase GcvT [Actibacterium pelagium]|nr:glycine cleavage system aminomethyltransferase GcvT [Actibacterium pelagium]